MMSAGSWIPQQSIVCNVLIVDNRTDISDAVIEHVMISSLQVAKSRIRRYLVGLRKVPAIPW